MTLVEIWNFIRALQFPPFDPAWINIGGNRFDITIERRIKGNTIYFNHQFGRIIDSLPYDSEEPHYLYLNGLGTIKIQRSKT